MKVSMTFDIMKTIGVKEPRLKLEPFFSLSDDKRLSINYTTSNSAYRSGVIGAEENIIANSAQLGLDTSKLSEEESYGVALDHLLSKFWFKGDIEPAYLEVDRESLTKKAMDYIEKAKVYYNFFKESLDNDDFYLDNPFVRVLTILEIEGPPYASKEELFDEVEERFHPVKLMYRVFVAGLVVTPEGETLIENYYPLIGVKPNDPQTQIPG